MSEKARPALIGGFVLVALALLAVGLFYLGAGRFTGNRLDLLLYFRTDISGLQVGAPVVLQGVQIGTVSGIRVEYSAGDNPVLVPVSIRVDEDAVIWPAEQPDVPRERQHDLLVERGLRARLALQSIVTGRLMVELGFFPDTPVQYQLPPGERIREIPTIPSELDELRRTLGNLPLQEIATSATKVLQGLDRLLNDPETQTLLKEINGAVTEIRILARNLNRQVEPLGTNMNAALEEIRELARRLDREARVLSEGFQKMATAVTGLAGDIDGEIKPLARDLRSAARSAEAGFDAANEAFDEAGSVLGEDSPVRVELMQALRRISAAAHSLRNMADYLERHPEALFRGKR